ncbi:hypothetical protein CDL12_25717 [Handroanthus impetiginosus]|uniref:C2H2-type domain-containing protein n=1 Tax=Handroanthus impetiginosus TaxID=429701 RepID=A0A2G9G900_9LAMI|nr:hypothetical protein CDL12_25717 [Handroanthus impetiginosus]
MQLAQEELVLIKGKRSKRPRLALTVATSSSTTADSACGGGRGVVSDSDNSGSSNSFHELTQSGKDNIGEEEDMANCLILLAKGAKSQAPPQEAAAAPNKAEGINYQCKTCNKSFPSFQALGGHRASHKKPIKAEEKKLLTDNITYKQENSTEESTILSLQIQSGFSGSPQNKTIRVHECSICGAEFASGQALGGHMRRHRPMPRIAPPPDGGGQQGKRQKNLLSLDLNLPAPEDNDHRESKFAFSSKEQVIVFSASSLVDCHIY